MGAVLALWCLFALASGDARAFCLDLGGDCSPSAAVPLGTCHDQLPDSGENPNCTSCVDILIHEDALASGSRPGPELQPPAAADLFGCAGGALLAGGDIGAAAAAVLIECTAPRAVVRTAVLRI